MDLRRRRSVLVRMTEDRRRLGTARITNGPAAPRAQIAWAGKNLSPSDDLGAETGMDGPCPSAADAVAGELERTPMDCAVWSCGGCDRRVWPSLAADLCSEFALRVGHSPTTKTRRPRHSYWPSPNAARRVVSR
jgi:hypothetical protein